MPTLGDSDVAMFGTSHRKKFTVFLRSVGLPSSGFASQWYKMKNLNRMANKLKKFWVDSADVQLLIYVLLSFPSFTIRLMYSFFILSHATFAPIFSGSSSLWWEISFQLVYFLSRFHRMVLSTIVAYMWILVLILISFCWGLFISFIVSFLLL